MWRASIATWRSHCRATLPFATVGALSWGSLEAPFVHDHRLQHVSCEAATGGDVAQKVETLPNWLAPMVMRPSDAWKDIARKEKMRIYDNAQRSAACQHANEALPPAPPSGHPSRLRLATYNVHYMRDNNLQPNLDRVLEAVRAIDADVVAMQEVALPRGLAKSSSKVDGGNSDGFNECMKTALQNAVKPVEGEEGTKFAQEMSKLGYEHVVYTPSFCPSDCDIPCVVGNAVFSRRSLRDHKAPANSTVTLDLDRKGYYPGVVGAVGCSRSAAIAVIGIGKAGSLLEPASVTIASVHLDVLAECGTYFGLAEGEFIRLLELEDVNYAARELPNLIVVGDFNSPAKSTTRCTPLHNRLGNVLEALSQSRDAFNQRHFALGGHGEGPRLKEEWCLTALEFAEHRLGYRHAWQLLQPHTLGTLPLYSHWSGQLIDHCLFRNPAPTRPNTTEQCGQSIRSVARFVGVFHTDASDHLPLIFDIEFSPAS